MRKLTDVKENVENCMIFPPFIVYVCEFQGMRHPITQQKQTSGGLTIVKRYYMNMNKFIKQQMRKFGIGSMNLAFSSLTLDDNFNGLRSQSMCGKIPGRFEEKRKFK